MQYRDAVLPILPSLHRHVYLLYYDLFMIESYEMCGLRMSEPDKRVALVFWTCVDASLLFGQQTRDPDRRTDLPWICRYNDRRTFEFRDVLSHPPHSFRFFRPNHNSISWYMFSPLPVR